MSGGALGGAARTSVRLLLLADMDRIAYLVDQGRGWRPHAILHEIIQTER